MNSEIAKIDTERLTGRKVEPDDMGLLYRMYTNEEVMYTLGGTRTFFQSKNYVSKMVEQWEKNNFGAYVFFDKSNGNFVGRCGFKNNHIEGKDEVELLYALMPTYWGKGYATEISKKLMDIAFEQLKLKDVIAFTLATNKPSQKVMEKAGFKFEKNFTYNNEPHVLYRLKK
jgi:ribosomal-protein-alanine N-acetyltransferase